MYPFRVEDREFFFGREELSARLEEKLTQHSFLAVLGPSGCGKSSLVLAGLFPALKAKEPRLELAYLTPGNDPLDLLEVSLPTSAPSALVVVDQFEELFTLCTDEGKRRAFLDRLLPLLETMRVILTMRADFWGACAPYRKLRELMQAHQELIAPMDAQELRRAIEKQAAKVNLRFEADLSNTILDDVQGEPAAMPLLQHALLELWKRRHGRWLRAKEYRALGGVKKAIAETAEAVYWDLSSADQERVRDLFVRLTRLDEGSFQTEMPRDSRQRMALDELVPAGSNPAETRALVKRLADAHLLVTGVNAVTGREEVEVGHEALIRYWPRLRGWLDEDRTTLRLRQGIHEAARNWKASGNDKNLLVHRGLRLQEAEQLRNHPRYGLSELERDYVNACVRARRVETALLWGGGVTIVLSVMLTLAIWAWSKQQLADELAAQRDPSVARIYLNSIGNVEHPISDAEIETLTRLGSESAAIRYSFLKQAVENEGVAQRLNRRVAYATHAAVRLESDFRRRAVQELLRPYVRTAHRSLKQSLAYAQIGHELSAWDDLEDFSGFARTVFLEAIGKAKDANNLSLLSARLTALPGTVGYDDFETLLHAALSMARQKDSYKSTPLLEEMITRIGEKLSPEDAAKALHTLIDDMERTLTSNVVIHDAEVYAVFRAALTVLTEPVRSSRAKPLYQAYSDLLSKPNQPSSLHTLARWITPRIGQRMSAQGTQAAARALLERIAVTKNPYDLRELAEQFAGLECDRCEDAAQLASRHLVTVLRECESDREASVLIFSISALSPWLSPADAKLAFDRGMKALKQVQDPLQGSYFERGLSPIAVRVDSTQATLVLIHALLESRAWVFREKQMLVDNLRKLSSRIPSTELEPLAQEIVQRLVHWPEPLEIVLEAIAPRFSEKDAEVAFDKILAVRKSQQVNLTTHRSMQLVLNTLGGKLSEAHRAVLAAHLQHELENTSDPKNIPSLACGLIAMPNVPSAAVRRAIERLDRALDKIASSDASWGMCVDIRIQLARKLPEESSEESLKMVSLLLEATSGVPDYVRAAADFADKLARTDAATVFSRFEQLSRGVTNPEFREALGRGMKACAGKLDRMALSELLLSPTCVGEARLAVLEALEKQTGAAFHGNVWNFVKEEGRLSIRQPRK